MQDRYPVVDLFAGRGGLSEGFSSLNDSNGRVFDLRLSVEKEPTAHQTLELRSFFRKFRDGAVPDDYFKFLRGEVSRHDLFSRFAEKAEAARREAWLAELGSPNVSEDELDGRISYAT